MIIKLKPILKRNELKSDEALLNAVKKALEPVLNLTEQFEKILKDKTVTFPEILQIVAIAPSIPTIASNGKIALGYLKSFNAKVAKDFSKWFEQEFDLENDNLERRIEQAIDLLAESYEAVHALIKLIPKLKSFYDSITAKAA